MKRKHIRKMKFQLINYEEIRPRAIELVNFVEKGHKYNQREVSKIDTSMYPYSRVWIGPTP